MLLICEVEKSELTAVPMLDIIKANFSIAQRPANTLCQSGPNASVQN